MKCVVLYTAAEDALTRAPEIFPAHSEWFGKFVADGTLLMIGTFADILAHGSMAIFTDRAAAEAFVAGDPFVREGIAASYELRDWNA
jgi:hypothetical protein